MNKNMFLSLSLSLAGTTGGILVLAFVVDIVVWYKAGSISFAEEQECEEGTAEEMATLKSQDAQTVDNDYLWRFRVTFRGERTVERGLVVVVIVIIVAVKT